MYKISFYSSKIESCRTCPLCSFSNNICRITSKDVRSYYIHDTKPEDCRLIVESIEE